MSLKNIVLSSMLVTAMDVLDTVCIEVKHNCGDPFNPLNWSSFVSSLDRCDVLH
jgi:hypothetical protein